MRPLSAIQWTRYPALWAVSAFSVGILGSSFLSLVLAAGVGGALVTAALVLLGIAGWHDRRRLVSLAPLLRGTALLLLLVAAGALRHVAFMVPAPNSIASVARASTAPERPYQWLGEVHDVPSSDGGATRFTLRARYLVDGSDTLAVQGQARVALRTPPWVDDPGSFPTVRSGDRVVLRGTLRQVPRPRNPGQFDYGAYLKRQGTCCVLRIDDPQDMAVLGDVRGPVGALLVAARAHVRNQLAQHVPTPEARAVLRALLLGERTSIDDATTEHFVATGLMHLLAVSGLHVLLVGMVLYGLLRPLLMRLGLRWQTVEIVRAVLTIGVLGFYMLLTGGRPSVVRAVVMASLLIGGTVLQRSGHVLNTLGVAALLLLAMRPPALFDAGFQLSMSAVAAIVTLNPRLTACLPDAWEKSSVPFKLASMVTVSIAATAGTLPVLLHHFGRASLAGLILNVPAIPVTGFALTAGLATVVWGGLSGWGAGAFGDAADMLVHVLLDTAAWGATWMGWSEIWVTSPGPWLLGAITLGVVAGAQWPRPRIRWRLVGAALFLLVVGAWMPVLHGGMTPMLNVVFLNVGQGDAALISTPNGRHVLVDAGPRTRYSDAGRTVVQPYLQSRGIHRLDAVVITHPDGDHLGGLASLLDAVEVGQVYHNGWSATSDAYAHAQKRMKERSIPSRALQMGDSLFVDPSVEMTVLSPPTPARAAGLNNENEASVVLRLRYGSTQWLFAGDVEHAGERFLVRTYGSHLASDVVKVAHHGSSTSSTLPFVQAVASGSEPPIAVISVGRENAFGMPSVRVVDRWRSHHARIATTAGGGVWLQTDGKTVDEVTWRP